MQTTSTHGQHHQPELVFITINRVRYDIPRGQLAVTSLKDWAEILAADELDQIIHGKFEPVADDATLEIKGGEVFISRPREAGSS